MEVILVKLAKVGEGYPDTWVSLSFTGSAVEDDGRYIQMCSAPDRVHLPRWQSGAVSIAPSVIKATNCTSNDNWVGKSRSVAMIVVLPPVVGIICYMMFGDELGCR